MNVGYGFLIIVGGLLVLLYSQMPNFIIGSYSDYLIFALAVFFAIMIYLAGRGGKRK